MNAKAAPPAGTPPEENRPAEAARRALLHELAEALTAVENYASVARSLAGGPHQDEPPGLAAALERLNAQVRRAVEALRRLRALMPPLDSEE